MTTLLSALLLLLSTAFPSNTRSTWMSPESFQLKIGMPRSRALEVLKQNGMKTSKGKAGELVVLYDNARTISLGFSQDKLKSARFEYVGFLPEVKTAFEEQKATLKTRFGAPKALTTSTPLLIYEKVRPNIYVVLSADRKTDYGKQGLGFLVVRYFDPAR